MSLIRREQSAEFGCVAQHLSDYLVVHYLLYQALYGELSLSIQLEGDAYEDVDLFYWHLSILSYLEPLLHATLWFLTAWFYLVHVRREITFFSFYA